MWVNSQNSCFIFEVTRPNFGWQFCGFCGVPQPLTANVVTLGSDKPHVTPTATNSLLTTSLYNASSWKGKKPMNLSPNKWQNCWDEDRRVSTSEHIPIHSRPPGSEHAMFGRSKTSEIWIHQKPICDFTVPIHSTVKQINHLRYKG